MGQSGLALSMTTSTDAEGPGHSKPFLEVKCCSPDLPWWRGGGWGERTHVGQRQGLQDTFHKLIRAIQPSAGSLERFGAGQPILIQFFVF